LNSEEFREAVSALIALQVLIDEGHQNNESEEFLEELIKQRDALRY